MKAIKFWINVANINGPGCWEWRGSVASNGYGRVAVAGRRMYVHRYSWMQANHAAIPDGMLVCHHCDNPICVRPDHLYVGTYADNARDMAVRGRSTKKTHCSRGHPLEGNRYFAPKRPNKGECRTCILIRVAQHKRLRRMRAA